MSSAPPKRARTKTCKQCRHGCKPQQLKLSYGSSTSGASGSLPSTMEASISEMVEQLEMKRQQAQVEDDHWYPEDANGNVTKWSPHKYSPPDFETDSPEALDSGPDIARVQEEVGHQLDGSGDATGRSDSHRQDFESDDPKVAENGADSMGLKEEDKSPVGTRDVEVLTETDIADIVRRAREFLEEQGPSQEEELCCEVVGPKLTALVRASFGSLAACLEQQPGFHHTREGDYSFLYYLDDKEEDSHSSAIDSPPLSPTSASGLLPADSPEDGPAEASGVAAGDDGLRSGHVSSPCSSPSHGSYVSALDQLDGEGAEEERRDACTQTSTGEVETTSCCQWHGARDTHDGQTQTCCLNTAELVEEELRLKEKIRVLEAKIVSLEDDHNREIRELRLELERLLHCGCQQTPSLSPPPEQPSQEAASGCGTGGEEAHRGSPSTNGGGVAGASTSKEEQEGAQLIQTVMPDNMLVNGICTEEEEADGSHADSSFCSGGGGAAHTEEEERLPSEPVAKLQSPAEAKKEASGPSVERSQGLDLAELRWRLELLRGNISAELKSVGLSRRSGSSSVPRSKSEAQITKIVRLLKRKLPHCTEADIRRHVDHMRRLRGGFSCLTLWEIVDLVLRHVIGKEEKEGER